MTSARRPRQLDPQTGRTIIVTGANSGIGLETTRELVRQGAHVVMAVRDTTRGTAAAAQLHGPGSTSILQLDLADLDQIPRFARAFLDRHDDLHALVANAGIMGGPLRLSPQGHELQMATNHLGHAALIAALWPLLEASRSRLVLIASGEARNGTSRPAPPGRNCSTQSPTTADRSTATASRPTCYSPRNCTAGAAPQDPT